MPGTVNTTMPEYTKLPFSIRRALAECPRMVSDKVGMPLLEPASTVANQHPE